MAKFPLEDWRAQQLRLTVFPSLDATTRSPEWWERAVGSQPDEVTANVKTGSGSVRGVFEPGTLALHWTPDRVDWFWMPAESDVVESAVPSEFTMLGPAVPAIEAFSTVMQRWLGLEDLPDIARIAFGAVLMHPEEDRDGSYRRLPDYVPVRVDPASSDFLYQVNLPPISTSTGVDGLQLNRLSRWSSVALRSVALNLADPRVQPKQTALAFALRLELDINTVPASVQFIPHERLGAVYVELAERAKDLARDGLGI